MFREMRRKKQMLTKEECEKILKGATSGVLAVQGDDEYPYAVPLSYVYEDGKLFFHSAVKGHKMDAIRRSSKASFCVIGQDRVIPERYTTDYRSVTVFGRLRILEQEEKRAAIEALALKYAPHDTAQNRTDNIEQDWNVMCVLELQIEHMTGKRAKEVQS